jgi:NADH dehydrogenase
VTRPRVVIIGGGFGGVAAAQALRGGNVDVMVIDRHNHFVFQPLLYQVASGLLAPSDIAVPIRWYLRRQENTSVVLGEVTSIDVGNRTVTINNGEYVAPYDFLIVAAGSRHAYFGHDVWEDDAPGLKSLDDALHMRSRFLSAFENAELTDDLEERQAWQTIVIVGGGPTGAELAGIMVTIARKALRKEFRRIDTARTRIILVEGGSRVLPTFPEELSLRALQDLQGMGVEVRLNSIVSDVDGESVRIGDEVIRTRTVFWAAGNAASPLSRQIGAPIDRVGRVLVEPDLSVPGHPEVFVVGDMAVTTQADGRPVPGVAQGGIQGGRTAGRNILRTLRRQERKAFRYLNKGDMATLGRHSAVADLGFVRFGGPLAWFIWLFIHIAYLAGFRNRLIVLVEWAWEYFTYQRGVRLILGDSSQAPLIPRADGATAGTRSESR